MMNWIKKTLINNFLKTYTKINFEYKLISFSFKITFSDGVLMINDLLIKTNKIAYKMQNCMSEKEIFETLILCLKSAVNSEIALIDINGKILLNTAEISFDNIQIETINKTEEIKFSILSESFYEKNFFTGKIYDAVFPIVSLGEKIASLVMFSKNTEFSDSDKIIIINCSLTLSIILTNFKNNELAEETRKKNDVRLAISTLSYSELEAVINIFSELKGNDGILIASRIAKKAGITRSVIVNAIRKLESAEIIESRSLGMKGTYIKVLNLYLFNELKKLKK